MLHSTHISVLGNFLCHRIYFFFARVFIQARCSIFLGMEYDLMVSLPVCVCTWQGFCAHPLLLFLSLSMRVNHLAYLVRFCAQKTKSVYPWKLIVFGLLKNGDCVWPQCSERKLCACFSFNRFVGLLLLLVQLFKFNFRFIAWSCTRLIKCMYTYAERRDREEKRRLSTIDVQSAMCNWASQAKKRTHDDSTTQKKWCCKALQNAKIIEWKRTGRLKKHTHTHTWKYPAAAWPSNNVERDGRCTKKRETRSSHRIEPAQVVCIRIEGAYAHCAT